MITGCCSCSDFLLPVSHPGGGGAGGGAAEGRGPASLVRWSQPGQHTGAWSRSHLCGGWSLVTRAPATSTSPCQLRSRAEITAVTVDCSAAPAPARPGLARRCCLASCCLVWFGAAGARYLITPHTGRHGNMGRVTPHTWLSP